MFNKNLLILIFILISIVSIYLFFVNNNSNSISTTNLQEQFDIWNISLDGIENFEIKNYSVDYSGSSYITDILALRGNEIIKLKKIDNVDDISASNYIRDKVSYIYGIYVPVTSPYFGNISESISCLEGFLPDKKNISSKTQHIEYFLLYANEKLNYGVCSYDFAKYRSILTFIHCKEKNELYRLDYFIPDEYDRITELTISKISC